MYTIITNNTIRSISTNKEIELKDDDIAISRTDMSGNILYYNNVFSRVSGYDRSELLNMPHSILRHPDMPKAIFYAIWQSILCGIPINAIIKNFTKEGDYYWIHIKFIVQRDNHNNIVSFLSNGRAVPKYAIEKIEPLYKNLLEDEYKHGRDSSIKLLASFLNRENIASYNDYICKIIQKKESSLFWTFTI